MRDTTYAQLVNRRLAAAKSLLMIESFSIINDTPVGRSAIAESALIQFYFAVYSYINELLSYHNKPSIEYPRDSLSGVLYSKKLGMEELNEFFLLKSWSESHGDVLYEISQIPVSLTELAPLETTESTAISYKGSSAQDKEGIDSGVNSRSIQLIAVTGEKKNKINLDSKEEIISLVDDFKLFISAQRENQAEY